jgi:hypothetical protein
MNLVQATNMASVTSEHNFSHGKADSKGRVEV